MAVRAYSWVCCVLVCVCVCVCVCVVCAQLPFTSGQNSSNATTTLLAPGGSHRSSGQHAHVLITPQLSGSHRGSDAHAVQGFSTPQKPGENGAEMTTLRATESEPRADRKSCDRQSATTPLVATFSSASGGSGSSDQHNNHSQSLPGPLATTTSTRSATSATAASAQTNALGPTDSAFHSPSDREHSTASGMVSQASLNTNAHSARAGGVLSPQLSSGAPSVSAAAVASITAPAPLSVLEVLRLSADVACGLAFLHQRPAPAVMPPLTPETSEHGAGPVQTMRGDTSGKEGLSMIVHRGEDRASQCL